MIAIIRALGTLKVEFGHSDRAVSYLFPVFIVVVVVCSCFEIYISSIVLMYFNERKVLCLRLLR